MCRRENTAVTDIMNMTVRCNPSPVNVALCVVFSLVLCNRYQSRVRCQAVVLLSSEGPLLSLRQILFQPDELAASSVDTHHAAASTGATPNNMLLSLLNIYTPFRLYSGSWALRHANAWCTFLFCRISYFFLINSCVGLSSGGEFAAQVLFWSIILPKNILMPCSCST